MMTNRTEDTFGKIYDYVLEIIRLTNHWPDEPNPYDLPQPILGIVQQIKEELI